MKRLLQLAFLLVAVAAWPQQGHAAIAFVQEVCASTAAASSSTLVCTVPAGGVALDSHLYCISGTGPGTQPSSFSDTGGNTYAKYDASDPRVNNGLGTNHYSMAVKAIITTALSSGDSITFTTTSASFERRSFICAEFSGLDTGGSSSDGQNTGIDNSFPQSSPMNSGSVTTTNADDLLVGLHMYKSNTVTATATASWTGSGTNLHNGNSMSYWLEYRIVTGTGTYSSTPALSANNYWTSYIMTTKAAAGGGGATTPKLTMMGVGD